MVNIDIKLKLHMNVRRYFGSNKVRGERNFVIFINLEILPDPEGSLFVSLFNTDNEVFQWNSTKYSINNDYLWNTAVYSYLFIFEIKSMCEIGALIKWANKLLMNLRV